MARKKKPIAQNNALDEIQNMPQVQPNQPNIPVQYIPPTPGQNLPQTKAQRKIANAKFPRARAGWEGFKGGLGNLGKDLKEGIFGTDVEQAPTVTPEQQSILQFLQQLGVQGLQNPYGGFAPIAQQATNQFNQETVPSLAHRFTSLGNASLSSPDFAKALGGAGANLQTDLSALQAGYGQQNIGQILQMLQLGLQPQFQNLPGQPGLLPSLFSNAGNFYQSYQMNQALKQLAK